MYSDVLIDRLCSAKSVAVLTGAGISAESGVPTFRDPDGLWAKFKPEELANFDAFMRNPDLVWEWYTHRRQVISGVAPNPGHFALVEMEELFSDFTLITQNVDNLHGRAGSTNPLELHGNIERNFCVECRKPYDEILLSQPKGVLYCECGGLIRPDVVWFGENLPPGILQKAWAAAERAEVFFSIGTSGEVYPAAQLPGVAGRNGAYVVEINPKPTMLSLQMNECILGPSGVILPRLVEALRRGKTSA